MPKLRFTQAVHLDGTPYEIGDVVDLPEDKAQLVAAWVEPAPAEPAPAAPAAPAPAEPATEPEA